MTPPPGIPDCPLLREMLYDSFATSAGIFLQRT
jgi:hypothetical protein